jgi:hypothetical protein
MKSAMFRSDGVGAVVGHLCAPDKAQYENNGKIGVFVLTGNVVETEYNDVLLVGKKTGEDTFLVEQMESLPKKDEGMLFFTAAGEKGEANCIAIPKHMIKESGTHTSESGTVYHTIKAEIGRNHFILVNIFGDYTEESGTDTVVLLLKGAPRKEERNFGSGYAVKRIISEYAAGWQVKS